MPTPPPRTWIYFFPLAESGAHVASVSKFNRYRVDLVKSIRGESVTDFKPGDEIVRMCSNDPLGAQPSILAGSTQHLHFTSDVQRDRLVAISAKEIPAFEQPITVLIPIRKSDTWWNLGHNARADYMNGSSTHRGHTKIGEEYASLIFRQLIHSRYLDSAKRHYDFLTYFEFPEANREGFKMLLQRLRDESLNPEWTHVEMEQEIWMRKVG